MNLRVRVERLVLEGLSLQSSERRAVGAAVEAELARVLSDAGLSAELRVGGASYYRVAAPDIPAASGRARTLGAQIGRAVGVSLTDPSARTAR